MQGACLVPSHVPMLKAHTMVVFWFCTVIKQWKNQQLHQDFCEVPSWESKLQAELQFRNYSFLWHQNPRVTNTVRISDTDDHLED